MESSMSQPKTRDQVSLSIAVCEEQIIEKMPGLTKLYSEFSLEWMLSVEKNFKQFVDYCECVKKTHEENKLKTSKLIKNKI